MFMKQSAMFRGDEQVGRKSSDSDEKSDMERLLPSVKKQHSKRLNACDVLMTTSFLLLQNSISP